MNLNKLSYNEVMSVIIENYITSEMEFKEFEPRFNSAKTQFNLSAILNLEMRWDEYLPGGK